MQAHDWSRSPLGPPERWPQALRVLVGVMLGAGQAMHLAWGREHTLLYNDGYARILGGKHPDALGCPLLEVWSELRGQLEPLVERVYAGESVHLDDMAFMLECHGHPEEAHFSFALTPVRDDGGDVVGLFCPCVETTMHVLADRQLRDSALQFSALAQALPNMVWVATPTGKVEWINERFCQYAGTDATDLLGHGWEALLHPDDRDRVSTLWTEALAFGAGYETELRLCRADGTYRWLLVRAVPVYDGRGQVLRWIGTNIDIEEQKHAVEQQRRLNEALEVRIAERTLERDRIWRNSRDLLMVLGADGVYRDVNPAWGNILGYTPEEVVGRNFMDFIWPEDADLSRVAHAQALSRIQLTNLEKRYRHKDGTLRWISWSTSTEGDMVYGSGRDITAEKAQAEALRQSEEQLRQSQKMEAVGQLTGGIAHDFNNLLGGIIGALELLQLRLEQGRTRHLRRYADSAMSSARRAAALVHRLLAFARRQPLDPRPVDVSQLVVDMRELTQRSIGPLHRLEIEAGNGLWITRCDTNQLESSILNLAINARDAMPDGGTLSIAVENVASAQRPWENLVPGDYVAISLADTGTGMAPEVLQRVLEPFFTTKPMGQGTGLGLSMVYGFAKQSQGHLRIQSEVGKGTRVTLYLPRFQGELVQSVEAPGKGWHQARASGTVLLVEDEPVLRELIGELLEDLGYRTLTAIDGPSGLAALQAEPGIDLLVTDIGLPGFDGRQLATRARVLWPHLKVLFITGYAEDAIVVEGFLDAGMQMLTKPFDLNELTELIRVMVLEE